MTQLVPNQLLGTDFESSNEDEIRTAFAEATKANSERWQTAVEYYPDFNDLFRDVAMWLKHHPAHLILARHASRLGRRSFVVTAILVALFTLTTTVAKANSANLCRDITTTEYSSMLSGQSTRDLESYLLGLKNGTFYFSRRDSGSLVAKRWGFNKPFPAKYSQIAHRVSEQLKKTGSVHIDEIIAYAQALLDEERRVDKLAKEKNQLLAAIAYLRMLEHGHCAFPSVFRNTPSGAEVLSELVAYHPAVANGDAAKTFITVYDYVISYSKDTITRHGSISIYQVMSEWRRRLLDLAEEVSLAEPLPSLPLVNDTKQSSDVTLNDVPLPKDINEPRSERDTDNTELKIAERLKEIERAEKWSGTAKSSQDLLHEGKSGVEASPANKCSPRAPILRAEILARHEVTIEALLTRIINAHENYLRGKTSKMQSAKLFNTLKNDAEAAQTFYNSNISKHCAFGPRMIAGLDKAEVNTITAINLLNNFVRDLNKQH